MKFLLTLSMFFALSNTQAFAGEGLTLSEIYMVKAGDDGSVSFIYPGSGPVVQPPIPGKTITVFGAAAKNCISLYSIVAKDDRAQGSSFVVTEIGCSAQIKPIPR